MPSTLKIGKRVMQGNLLPVKYTDVLFLIILNLSIGHDILTEG